MPSPEDLEMEEWADDFEVDDLDSEFDDEGGCSSAGCVCGCEE